MDNSWQFVVIRVYNLTNLFFTFSFFIFRMRTRILKVVSQTEPVYVPSESNTDGVLPKCEIRLKEPGGTYEEEYICVMYGNLALLKFYEGDLVIASLRFRVHEKNDVVYQNVKVCDIHKLSC